MAAGFAKAGNQLYTGERSYPFIQRSRLWFLIAAAVVVISIAIPFLRGGFNLGIEFTGGSEFTISQTTKPMAASANRQCQSPPARKPRAPISPVTPSGVRPSRATRKGPF